MSSYRAVQRAILVAAAIASSLIAPHIAHASSDRCQAVAQAPGRPERPHVHRTALKKAEVGIRFIGHATFLIESPDGVRIATDFGDLFRPDGRLDIVTMNRAHSSHYTDTPPASIKHVLRGWNPDGGPAAHDLDVRDVHVRNVPTNTRWGDRGLYGAYGNSIFIFEVGGLCIGHLGHLHHTLSAEQLATIGQLDIVMVPVDAGYTMDLGGVIEVLRGLRARLILPMHYFNTYTLNRFLDRIRGEFPIEMAERPDIVVSRTTLPDEPKVVVLPGL